MNGQLYFDPQTRYSDDELVLEIARGSNEAFEAFYRRFARNGLRFLGMRLKAEDAQDVLQEAFLQVWRRAASYDPARGSAAAWFLSILRSRCLDRLGRRKNQPADSMMEIEQTGPSEEPRILTDLLVQGLMQTLDRRRSRVMMLTFFGGMSHRETAQHLKAPLGTVKGQIRSSLIQFRKILQKSGTLGQMQMRMAPESSNA